MFSLSWTPYLRGLFIRRCWFPSPSPHHHVRRLPGVYRTHCSWRREGNYCWAAADSGHDLWDVGTERHVAQHQGHKHRLLPAGQAASTSPLFLVLSCLLHVIKSIGLYQGVTVCLEALRKAFPESDSLQRTTKFFYTPTFRQSEAGISIGPNSSTPATSRYILNLYTTPAPAFEVQSQNQTSGSFSWVFFILFMKMFFFLSGSQWEGHFIPAPTVCAERSQCGNVRVQLCFYSLLCFHCSSGAWRNLNTLLSYICSINHSYCFFFPLFVTLQPQMSKVFH